MSDFLNSVLSDMGITDQTTTEKAVIRNYQTAPGETILKNKVCHINRAGKLALGINKKSKLVQHTEMDISSLPAVNFAGGMTLSSGATSKGFVLKTLNNRQVVAVISAEINPSTARLEIIAKIFEFRENRAFLIEERVLQMTPYVHVVKMLSFNTAEIPLEDPAATGVVLNFAYYNYANAYWAATCYKFQAEQSGFKVIAGGGAAIRTKAYWDFNATTGVRYEGGEEFYLLTSTEGGCLAGMCEQTQAASKYTLYTKGFSGNGNTISSGYINFCSIANSATYDSVEEAKNALVAYTTRQRSAKDEKTLYLVVNKYDSSLNLTQNGNTYRAIAKISLENETLSVVGEVKLYDNETNSNFDVYEIWYPTGADTELLMLTGYTLNYAKDSEKYLPSTKRNFFTRIKTGAFVEAQPNRADLYMLAKADGAAGNIIPAQLLTKGETALITGLSLNTFYKAADDGTFIECAQSDPTCLGRCVSPNEFLVTAEVF